MYYGAKAKEWITDHDIKQKTLAKEFGITEAMLSNYLTGRNDMPVAVLVQLARRFDLSMDYLVGLTDTPERPPVFSDEEKQLVHQFRTLARNQKELILQNLQLMQAQNQR